jgi:hypothetical protein
MFLKNYSNKHLMGTCIATLTLFLVFNGFAVGQSAGLKKVEYNKEQLVQNVVVGTIAPARLGTTPYRLGADGSVSILPATGSVTLNFRSGDSAVNLAGDHVEPAVTLYYSDDRSGSESRAFNIFSCVGNEVKVLTGEAKGATGVVIGKHGGSEHVMVDFSNPEVMKNMIPGDKMVVYSWGLGMELTNIKDVKAMNMSPQLMDALTRAGMGITATGKLRIPVALTVPAKVMGSGLGSDHVYSGDYDIQMFDEKVNREYGLDKLRFGDIVAIIDADNSYGRIFKTGAITIGVVTHSNSVIAGHGPGVTTLFTSSTGNIEYYTDNKANLLFLLLQ